MTFDRCSKRYYWSVKWYSEPPFIWCLPIRQEILNVSQIAVTLHDSAHHSLSRPDCNSTADVPSFTLRIALSQQSHLFPICVVLTYNDSRLILHCTCQIPRNCQCKCLLVSSSAPGTSLGSSGFPEIFTRVRL